MNLQQFIEDTDRELDKKWYLHHLDEKSSSFTTVGEDVKQFLHTRLRALLEEVVGEAEGRKLEEDFRKIEGGGSFASDKVKIADRNRIHNKALSSLASHLQEKIKKIV